MLHFFATDGVQPSLEYCTDNCLLDSTDAPASVYLRNGNNFLNFEGEFRTLQLELAEFDFIRRRQVDVGASGLGVQFDLFDNVDTTVSGLSFDCSIDLRFGPAGDIVNLMSANRPRTIPRTMAE